MQEKKYSFKFQPFFSHPPRPIPAGLRWFLRGAVRPVFGPVNRIKRDGFAIRQEAPHLKVHGSQLTANSMVSANPAPGNVGWCAERFMVRLKPHFSGCLSGQKVSLVRGCLAQSPQKWKKARNCCNFAS